MCVLSLPVFYFAYFFLLPLDLAAESFEVAAALVKVDNVWNRGAVSFGLLVELRHFPLHGFEERGVVFFVAGGWSWRVRLE